MTPPPKKPKTPPTADSEGYRWEVHAYTIGQGEDGYVGTALLEDYDDAVEQYEEWEANPDYVVIMQPRVLMMKYGAEDDEEEDG